MQKFNQQAFEVEAKVLAFITTAVLCNAVSAHNWIAVKWALGAAGAALLGLVVMNSPKRIGSKGDAGYTIKWAGGGAIVSLMLLALVLSGALAMVVTGAAATICFAVLSLRGSNVGWSLGKTFAFGLPILFAAQLAIEKIA